MDGATFEAIQRGDAKLELREPLDWKVIGTRVRASHRLKTVLSVPITLFAGIPLAEAHRPTFLIRDDGQRKRNIACRLDVRGTHTNRRTDSAAWVNRTHLHVWRDVCGAAHAIDPPPPWPPPWFRDDATNITSDQLRELFETFCRLFHVKLSAPYDWSDPLPLIGEAEALTTEDGDVVP